MSGITNTQLMAELPGAVAQAVAQAVADVLAQEFEALRDAQREALRNTLGTPPAPTPTPKAAQAKTPEFHAAKANAYLPKYEANSGRTLTEAQRVMYVNAWVEAAMAGKSPIAAARKASR